MVRPMRRVAAYLLVPALSVPALAGLARATETVPVTSTVPASVAQEPAATPVASTIVPMAPVKAANTGAIDEARLLAAAPGLSREVLDHALTAHAAAKANGDLKSSPHPERLTVIDYSRPSTEKRLWVLDLDSGKVLFHELVAHGQGSGGDVPSRFSDDDGSHMSSLGVFRTAETYVGKHGRSLRLDGLEPGFNEQARSRAVVVHAADYVSEAFAASHGRLGRSWGCPAVRPEISQELIDAIGGGTLVVAYFPDAHWLGSSKYLNQ